MKILFALLLSSVCVLSAAETKVSTLSAGTITGSMLNITNGGVTNSSGNIVMTNTLSGSSILLGTNGFIQILTKDKTTLLTGTNGSLRIIQSNGNFILMGNGSIRVSGGFVGDGSGLTNLSGVSSGGITNGQASVTLASPFSISGTEGNLTMSNDKWRIKSFSSNGLFTIENDNLSIPLISLDYAGVFFTNTHASNFFSGVLYGDGAGLSNVAGITLPDGLITNNQTGVTLTGSFSGNGGGLTNLPATSSDSITYGGTNSLYWTPNSLVATNSGGSYMKWVFAEGLPGYGYFYTPDRIGSPAVFVAGGGYLSLGTSATGVNGGPNLRGQGTNLFLSNSQGLRLDRLTFGDTLSSLIPSFSIPASNRIEVVGADGSAPVNFGIIGELQVGGMTTLSNLTTIKSNLLVNGTGPNTFAGQIIVTNTVTATGVILSGGGSPGLKNQSGFAYISDFSGNQQISSGHVADSQYPSVLNGLGFRDANNAAAIPVANLYLSSSNDIVCSKSLIVIGTGPNTFAGPLNVTNTITATNFVYSRWRWDDGLTSLFITTAGNTAPVQVDMGNGVIAYGYDLGANPADASCSIQFRHKFAETNAVSGQENFYLNPHAHVAATTLAGGTNATFVLRLYIAPVNGSFQMSYYQLTNTIGFTATNQNNIINFGFITNNAWSGKSSVMARARLVRQASTAQDIGNGAVVILDSFDIHYPFDQIGSAAVSGD